MFKHSIRFLKRQKGYLLINIAGLSVGIASSLIIALFVNHELNYDRYNVKKDRIYRLIVNGVIGDRELSYAVTSAPVGPTMLKEFPEVENFTRISTWNEPVIKHLDKMFIETAFIESDSTFFDVFSIPLIRGDKRTVLNAPHTLVLSASTARKLFGREDPIDKLLDIGKDTIPYRITGIMADIPETSHFRANMIGSFMTNPGADDRYWANNNYSTYILLKPKTNYREVEVKIAGLIRKNMADIVKNSFGMSIDEFVARNKYRIYMQPLKDVHFDPAITQLSKMKPAKNPKYLYIFISVAILIILIATINFMNLSTAQASKRSKEVGIKKVCGSPKGMLIRQFLTESVLITFLSLVIAVILIENSLPYFSNLLDAKLEMNLFANWYSIPVLILLTIVTGMLAGSYPAFFLSSLKPITVLKGKLRDSVQRGKLRSILVILQFSISIMLIVGTIIMVRQIRFMLNKDLGFNKEQLLVISHAEAVGNHMTVFREALANIPGIVKVTSSTAVPGHSEQGKTYSLEGKPGEVMDFKINYVDHNFFDTYGISFSDGRVFNELSAAENIVCIVNESTVKQLNLTNPLTSNLTDGYEKISIVGIVKNFNFESLHHEINPYIFRVKGDNDNYGYISIRLSAEADAITLSAIEKTWNDFALNDPFQFFFIDEDFAQKYKEEKQNAQLSMLFSILAITIAALGLFGLTSFTMEQRTKEIGIRKSMGSTSTGIFYLISKEFVFLVFISALISWPLIYFIAKNWLQSFYYRINLRPLDFLAGFAVVVIIALITTCYQTLKSARTNPVEALRYE